MAASDLIVYSYAGSPSCSVYDVGTGTNPFSSSFAGSLSFAGPIKFDPINRHFAFLHNGIGGGGYASDGHPRLFRWNGLTWVRDAADLPFPGSRPTGLAWHDGDLLLRSHGSNALGMERYDLDTDTYSTFVLPGSGTLYPSFDVVGDILYYYDNAAGTVYLMRYDLAASSALTPITVAARGDFDVADDGRIIMVATSAYYYSPTGTLLATHVLPGSGTVRAARFSQYNPESFWVMRASGLYEVDLVSGSTLRSITGGLAGNDQMDVLLKPSATSQALVF